MKQVRAEIVGIYGDDPGFLPIGAMHGIIRARRGVQAAPVQAPAPGSTSDCAGRLFFALVICFLLTCIYSGVEAQSPNPHAVSMYNLGLTAYKQGSPESAIIFFKRACDIDPNLVDAQYNLGIIYQSQKRIKEAAPRFEQVLRIKPNDPDAHYQLALVLLELGQAAESRQHFASIAPNNMHFADAQKRLGLLESQSREPGQTSQPPLTATQPSSSPNYDNRNVPATSSPYQPGTSSPPFKPETAPPSTGPSTVPQPAPPIQPTGPGTAQTQPQTSAQNSYAASFSPPTTQNSQAVSYAQPSASVTKYQPPAVSNPVPVIANSSVRVIATGFSAPAGLAFDKYGNLYVANFLTNTVDRLSVDGSRSQFSTGAHLKGPIGLCIDDLGNIYVANYTGGTVARINPAGVSAVIATGFRKPYYLTLDKDGNIFVSQQEDNSIARIALPRPVSSKL